MPEVTVSSAWSSAYPSDTNKLVSKVARLYGLQDDADAKAIALDALDDAVKELNNHLYEFNVVSVTGLTMTADQAYIQLAVPAFKEKLAYLIRASDSKKMEPLTYLDWAAFSRLYPSHVVHSDLPETYSFRNVQEEGRVYLGPAPSAGTATDYTLTLEYYRRIALPSETNQLIIFQEAENALLYGAKMRFAQDVMGMDAPDVATFAALFTQAEEKLKGLDRRHPDEAPRFRIKGRPPVGLGHRYSGGIIYVKV